MGAGHLKSGRSQMRANNLSYEMFKGVNYGALFFYEIGLKVTFSFHSGLPWMWTASFRSAYLSQSSGL